MNEATHNSATPAETKGFDLAAALRPKPLSYYESLVLHKTTHCKVALSVPQAAAVLKAYDRGTHTLEPREADILASVLAALKHSIWP